MPRPIPHTVTIDEHNDTQTVIHCDSRAEALDRLSTAREGWARRVTVTRTDSGAVVAMAEDPTELEIRKAEARAEAFHRLMTAERRRAQAGAYGVEVEQPSGSTFPLLAPTAERAYAQARAALATGCPRAVVYTPAGEHLKTFAVYLPER